MRALLLADACNPEWPSLPVVAYKYAKALAEHADVTVVTQIRNQANIAKHGFGKAKAVYLDTEKIAKPLFNAALKLRGGMSTAWTLQVAMDYPSYVYFERTAWKLFRDDLVARRFDIVHRITPMSPTLPSPMASWSPVPFVLGPLNGNLPWPPQFRAELRREREWMSYLRNVSRYLPYYRSTYRDSAAILAAFQHTIDDLPVAERGKVINFPEVGIDPDLFTRRPRADRERMTILYAGRLVPYKVPEVVVRAFAANPALRQHRLLVAGDGPESVRLKSIIDEHGLHDCVQLLGQKTQREVGELMQEADIFAFPSIRELGAGVVVEAMACGMACVVVDYGGPATLIDADRGVKVPMGSLDELVGHFAREIEALTRDPDRVATLGRNAYDHVKRYYTWEAKALKTLEVYEWVLDRSRPRPDFWEASRIVDGLHHGAVANGAA